MPSNTDKAPAGPRRIDETHDAALPGACPACGGDVHGTRVVSQYQEDLPVVRPVVREYRVHGGARATCGRRVQGRHPLQNSDALGAAAVIDLARRRPTRRLIYRAVPK